MHLGLVLGAGVVGGIVLAVVGLVVVALAAMRTLKRAARLRASAVLTDIAELAVAADRLAVVSERLLPLLERARVALAKIDAALREMRMPQAIAALRTAGAALSLLSRLR